MPNALHNGHRYRQRRRQVLEANPVCALRYPGCTGVATTVDCIVPISRGGTTDVANLQPACRHCNTSRGNRPIRRSVGVTSRAW